VKATEVKRAPTGDGGIDMARAAANDLHGRLPFLAPIQPCQIKVLPVAIDLLPELGATGKALPVKELILHQPMDRLDIALPSVGLGRDVAVVAA
jgi:hypothetical protein